jgi:AcrR family transcriptional regulator
VPRPKTIDDGAVLAAAVELIGRSGPDGLTLAALAQEVGLAPATLVQRFGSKRGLLLAIARQGASDAGPPPGAERPLAALVDWLVGRTRPVASPDALANHLAFLQIDLADPEFLELARGGARALRRELRTLLERALAAGELRPGTDAKLLAIALETAYNGALVTWAIHREGRLDRWMRARLEATLEPHRT